MIIETVVTTLDEDGQPHFAAMGVRLGRGPDHHPPLREHAHVPEPGRAREAVVNVTDDVLLFAKSALTHERLRAAPAMRVRGAILGDACHWREVAGRGDRGPARARGRQAAAPMS